MDILRERAETRNIPADIPTTFDRDIVLLAGSWLGALALVLFVGLLLVTRFF